MAARDVHSLLRGASTASCHAPCQHLPKSLASRAPLRTCSRLAHTVPARLSTSTLLRGARQQRDLGALGVAGARRGAELAPHGLAARVAQQVRQHRVQLGRAGGRRGARGCRRRGLRRGRAAAAVPACARCAQRPSHPLSADFAGHRWLPEQQSVRRPRGLCSPMACRGGTQAQGALSGTCRAGRDDFNVVERGRVQGRTARAAEAWLTRRAASSTFIRHTTPPDRLSNQAGALLTSALLCRAAQARAHCRHPRCLQRAA